MAVAAHEQRHQLGGHRAGRRSRRRATFERQPRRRWIASPRALDRRSRLSVQRTRCATSAAVGVDRDRRRELDIGVAAQEPHRLGAARVTPDARPGLGFDRGADARAAEPDRVVARLIGVDVGRIGRTARRQWRWRGTRGEDKSDVQRAHSKMIVASVPGPSANFTRDVLIYVVRARRRLHRHRAGPPRWSPTEQRRDRDPPRRSRTRERVAGSSAREARARRSRARERAGAPRGAIVVCLAPPGRRPACARSRTSSRSRRTRRSSSTCRRPASTRRAAARGSTRAGRSRRRRRRATRALAAERALPATAIILRAAGIYGPGRGHRRSPARRDVSDHRRRRAHVSRIHVDDLVEAILRAGTSTLTGPINCADDDPAPIGELADRDRRPARRAAAAARAAASVGPRSPAC